MSCKCGNQVTGDDQCMSCGEWTCDWCTCRCGVVQPVAYYPSAEKVDKKEKNVSDRQSLMVLAGVLFFILTIFVRVSYETYRGANSFDLCVVHHAPAECSQK